MSKTSNARLTAAVHALYRLQAILVLLEVVIALPSRQRPLKVTTSRGFRRRVFFIRSTVRRELTGLHPG